MMVFQVFYEVPPMRGIFRTLVRADRISDVEKKIRMNPKTAIYRIKKIEEITDELNGQPGEEAK